MTIHLEAGIHEQMLSHRGQRYTIAIPGSYADGEAVPLIVVLHWGGVVAPFCGKSILAYVLRMSIT